MGSTRQNYRLVDVGTIILFSIVTTKLLVHLYASRNYGYFTAQAQELELKDSASASYYTKSL